MKYLSEKDAENLLENFGFNVVRRFHISKKSQISDGLSFVGLPCVMKVSGKKIVHKNRVGGIRLNIETYSHALRAYDELKKIKGADGVMVQKKLAFSTEFLLGIKKTAEFGHTLVFGSGGTGVEEKKDVAFRVCPLDEKEVLDLLKDVEITKKMGKKESLKIAEVILKLCDLVKEYPDISELDINPFVLAGSGPVILDARILFD